MKETNVVSLGDPGTFDITDKTDPMYYIARYAHEQSMNLRALEVGAFRWEQDEDSDITAIQTDLDAYAVLLDTWFFDAVAASEGGLPIPAPPTVPALPGKTIGQILLSLFIRIAIRIIINWLKKKLDSGTEAGEIAQVLKKGLIGVAGGTEYSFIELLQNTPLEIIINRKDDYQDITYESGP